MRKSVIIFLLLACNVVLAAMLVLGMMKNRERWARPHETIIRELGFNEQQADAYRVLLGEHRDRVNPMLVRLREEKEKYFTAAARGAAPLAFNQINRTQNQLDSLLGAHLAAVYKLCTPAQQQRFDEAVRKVVAQVPR